METFSERLVQKRKEKGLTQEDVGKKLGKSRQAVNHYESGRIQPSNTDLIILADLLECTVDYLLRGTDLPTTKSPVLETVERELYQKQIDALLQTISIMSSKLGKRKRVPAYTALAAFL